MNNLVSVKTNFTSGQVSQNLYGRGDLKIFENGARCLENIIIHPTGGISRRKGTKLIEQLDKPAKLIPFEFNTEQIYLLCIMDGEFKVYKNGICITTIASPWKETQLYQLSWTQSADTLLIVHPDVAPQQISRNTDEAWKIEEWSYYTKDGMTYCPYFNFFQKKENITPTGTTGNISLNSSNPIFDEDYVDSLIKINNGLVKITAYNSPTKLTGTTLKNLANSNSSTDWEENSFSKRRGYPSSVAFHQDRMVIGGSKNLPNRLWMSKSSDLFNFDLGKGLDDEAIEFAILSDQVNAIKAVVSSRHLLVFTTGAEWMVSGDPLTPNSIQLRRQTSIGSYAKQMISPQQIDGATVFISYNGSQLREFLYTDVEQAYQAKDLTLLSTDILAKPIDIAFSQNESVLYIILEDGSISCLTSYRTEEVNAWSKLKTNGKFISIAVLGDEIYFSTYRNGKYFIEQLVDNSYADCSIYLSSEIPQNIWSGLDYLEGMDVSILADGFSVGQHTVNNGSVELLETAKELIIGVPYAHLIEPLPYMVEAINPYSPSAVRIINARFRVINTKSFRIDLGQGYFQVPLKRVHRDTILDSPPQRYLGDINLRSLGWIREMEKPMWSIKDDEPLEFTLLAAVLEIKIK